ncbi:MAG: M23 family metallopeptidase [Bacillota bacterium]|nr:M23 family metallopeptidase [Bacillota bacterium]
MALFWRRALWRWRAYRAWPRRRKSPWRWWVAFFLALGLGGLSRWPDPAAQRALQGVKTWTHQTAQPFSSLPVFPTTPAPSDVLDLSLGSLAPPVAGAVVGLFGFSREGQRPVYRTEILLQAQEGEPVGAAESGQVAKIAQGENGLEVVIDHGGGWQTVYSFLSDLQVREGGKVEKGAILGHLAGDRLHLTLLYRGQPVDPLPYLGDAPSIP